MVAAGVLEIVRLDYRTLKSCSRFIPEGAETEDGSSEEEDYEEESSDSWEEEKQTLKPNVKKAKSANMCLIVFSTKTASTPQGATTGGQNSFNVICLQFLKFLL